jgi:hypothetical protein
MNAMDEEHDKLAAPPKQTLFPVSADDVLDNALQNLDERQAREVTRKAADEAVRLAAKKRRAEQRSESAQGEIRNLIDNANLLDRRGGDYKINSTFQTATGTTSVEITKSKTRAAVIVAALIGLVAFLIVLVIQLVRM